MPRRRRRSGSRRLPTISSREEGWKITGSVWCSKLVEQGRKPYITFRWRGEEMYEGESAVGCVGWRKADCASPRETSARRVGSSAGYAVLLAERGGPGHYKLNVRKMQ
ncbi:hypothetical protein BHM03_00047694, partial [Ensete ventricosum]